MRLALALLLLAPLRAAAASTYGVLLLAHGGDSSWNREVEALRERVDAKVPVEAALGMADHDSLQAAVDRLQRRGASRIIAVPLFVQSRSEVLDQTRYALGLSDKPSEALRAGLERMAGAHAGHAGMAGMEGMSGMPGHGHSFSLERVKARVPIRMSAALDDHGLVSRILLERAKALSKESGRETVILVAHGPVDETALPAWRASLASLCRAFKAYRGCAQALLRDDAAPEVRAAAVKDLRGKVSAAASRGGRAVVVPVLIARGGIERKIPKDLEGLDYAWDGRTLMPHDGFGAWVLERAAAAARDNKGTFDRPRGN